MQKHWEQTGIITIIGEKFSQFAVVSGYDPEKPQEHNTLAFLQTGVDIAPSFNSPEVQLPAILAFTNTSWATNRPLTHYSELVYI